MPAERQGLLVRLAAARRETRLALLKTSAASVIVCGVLALLTLAASDAPRSVIIAFWSALAVLFALWIGLPWHRTMRQQVVWLDDALVANRARVTRITSDRVVEFAEEEDEGACYAFEHGPGAVVFVVGQEFYEDFDFPNSDFSLVELLGSHGRPVDTLLNKTGQRLLPERVIPASTKWQLEIPEHLTVVDAPLDRVEEFLPLVR
jgi:hypothetical protein